MDKVYGLAIGGAMLLCIVLAYFLLKKKGYNPDIVFDVAIICIPCAIVGARLYYIVFDIIGGDRSWSYWFGGGQYRWLGIKSKEGNWQRPKLEGLAVYGGIIFAALGAIIVWHFNKKKPKKKDRMSYIQMLDFFFILIILGQAIGRWGNFANKEAYGRKVNFSFFPITVKIPEEKALDTGGAGNYLATFFYESLWNIIGFCIMLKLYFGKKKSYDGFMFSFYCLWYGVGRTWIESLRMDSLMFGPFRVSILVSVALILFGAGNIAYHVYSAKKTGKKPFILIDGELLDNSYFGYEKTIMCIIKESVSAEETKQAEESNEAV